MGDFDGHPFRGNQYTTGQGGGAGVNVSRGDYLKASLPKNARAAARTIADALEAQGNFAPGTGMNRAEAEKNWHKSLEGRVHNTSESRRAVVEAAHRENLDNPIFREIVETHAGGYGAVVLARSAPGQDKMGERLGGTTFVYDSPSILAEGEYELRNDVPKPGGSTASSHGGMAGVLRHEFGHHVYDVLEYNAQHRPAREELSQALAAIKDVGKELTHYAASSHIEAFAEALALGTHPKYRAENFSPEVHRYVSLVIKHARAGRGKTVRKG